MNRVGWEKSASLFALINLAEDEQKGSDLRTARRFNKLIIGELFWLSKH